MQNLFWASVVMRKRLGNVFKTNYTDFSMVSTSLQLSLTQKYEEKKLQAGKPAQHQQDFSRH